MTRPPLPSMSEVPASLSAYFARIEHKLDDNAIAMASLRERLRRIEQLGGAGADPSLLRRLEELENAHANSTMARIDKLERTMAMLVKTITDLQVLTEAIRKRVTMRSVAFGALTVAGSACGSSLSPHLVRFLGGQ